MSQDIPIVTVTQVRWVMSTIGFIPCIAFINCAGFKVQRTISLPWPLKLPCTVMEWILMVLLHWSQSPKLMWSAIRRYIHYTRSWIQPQPEDRQPHTRIWNASTQTEYLIIKLVNFNVSRPSSRCSVVVAFNRTGGLTNLDSARGLTGLSQMNVHGMSSRNCSGLVLRVCLQGSGCGGAQGCEDSTKPLLWGCLKCLGTRCKLGSLKWVTALGSRVQSNYRSPARRWELYARTYYCVQSLAHMYICSWATLELLVVDWKEKAFQL